MILGYTRCSTVEQAAAGTTTMQEQERVIRGVAMTKGAGSFDVQIFSDPGVSGATPLEQRPAGRELLAAMSRGDTVCASKLDRMFRSAIDALATAEKMQKEGIDLILFDLGVDAVTTNGMAKCFFTMASAFAELERSRIAERMNDGREAKRARGGVIGAIPYGFRKQGHGKSSQLVEDDAEQAVVAEAARVFRTHPSYHTVALRLHSQGILSRTGQKFQAVQIQRMLASKIRAVA
jgi:DNA invertase Pin-like site-specific DNA recombinase